MPAPLLTVIAAPLGAGEETRMPGEHRDREAAGSRRAGLGADPVAVREAAGCAALENRAAAVEPRGELGDAPRRDGCAADLGERLGPDDVAGAHRLQGARFPGGAIARAGEEVGGGAADRPPDQARGRAEPVARGARHGADLVAHEEPREVVGRVVGADVDVPVRIQAQVLAVRAHPELERPAVHDGRRAPRGGGPDPEIERAPLGPRRVLVVPVVLDELLGAVPVG